MLPASLQSIIYPKALRESLRPSIGVPGVRDIGVDEAENLVVGFSVEPAMYPKPPSQTFRLSPQSPKS